ncbi:MAG: NAD(P)H-dependent oxidoreductase subunit E [Anaerolineaceae bacterium]
MSDTPKISDPLQNPAKKAIIDAVIQKYADLPGSTMVVLNNLQEKIGYLTKPMQEYVAQKLHVPISKVHGVVSFYSFFTTEPRGQHVIKFCIGTACYVGGAPQLIDKAKQVLGIEPGQTTADGLVTLEVCRCVGACSAAPVVVIDELNHGRMQPQKFTKAIQDVIKVEAVA